MASLAQAGASTRRRTTAPFEHTTYSGDLRRIQDAVYDLGLAQPASSFDPALLPARSPARSLAWMSGLSDVVARCRTLQGWLPRRAAE